MSFDPRRFEALQRWCMVWTQLCVEFSAPEWGAEIWWRQQQETVCVANQDICFPINCNAHVLSLTSGWTSIRQTLFWLNTLWMDSRLVPYRLSLYSPYSINLQRQKFTINYHRLLYSMTTVYDWGHCSFAKMTLTHLPFWISISNVARVMKWYSTPSLSWHFRARVVSMGDMQRTLLWIFMVWLWKISKPHSTAVTTKNKVVVLMQIVNGLIDCYLNVL